MFSILTHPEFSTQLGGVSNIVYNLSCNPSNDPTLDCPNEGGENHKQVKKGLLFKFIHELI
jgi:hypothetical protein